MSKVNLVVVATINPNEKEALSFYLEKIGKLYQEANASSVGKYKISKAVIGQYTPSLVSVMEFEDMDSYKKVFESSAYEKLLPYREKAFSKLEGYLT